VRPHLLRVSIYTARGAKCGKSNAAGEDRHVHSFGPGTPTVPGRTTIAWTNPDDIPHTLVNADGLFPSKILCTDDKFYYLFGKVVL
jgi:plastocyanin